MGLNSLQRRGLNGLQRRGLDGSRRSGLDGRAVEGKEAGQRQVGDGDLDFLIGLAADLRLHRRARDVGRR